MRMHPITNAIVRVACRIIALHGSFYLAVPISSLMAYYISVEEVPVVFWGCPWYFGGARGVMCIVVGIGYGDKSSNPGRD